MRTLRITLHAALAGILLPATLLLGALGYGAPALAGAAPPLPRGSAGKTITLLTGDRVAVAGQVVSIHPGPGRDHIGFQRYVSHGDTFVLPLDAAPLVGAGRVDRRLFNVTQLVRRGYDDGSRGTMPLIVTGGSRPQGRALASLGATAVTPDKAGLGALWSSIAGRSGALAPGVERVQLDGPVTVTLDRSAAQIGAPAAWAAGYTGKGALVAVLDTGVDTKHPDLTDAVLESRDFTGSSTGSSDVFGHGTHVASIITGSGKASQAGHVFKGVAPDTRLLNGKVLGDDGSGTESAIVAGMEWAAAKGARVINMSLGSDFPAGEGDVLTAAVNRLTAETGALFVVAAGNAGPTEYTIGSPADADAALTVGAVDRANLIADLSSRGPRLSDGGVKPEITAPGVGIAAAYAQHGRTDSPYVVYSGTSMASPHVAGVAALVAAKHPNWQADRIKAALTSTALRSPTATLFQQGSGRVDAAKALTQSVYSATSVINHGLIPWPRTDDAPLTRTITYINTSTAPVTLSVSTDIRTGANTTAPKAVFTLSASTLTIPANGQSSLKFTTDTRPDTTSALYRGVVIATGPNNVRVRVPVSVQPESERYNLTFRAIDRSGALTSRYFFRVTELDSRAEYYPYHPSGVATLRLPPGRYFAEMQVESPGAAGQWEHQAVGVEPEVFLAKNTTVSMDARTAKPISLSVQRAGARMTSAVVRAATPVSPTDEVGTFFLAPGGDFAHMSLRASVTKATRPFQFVAEATFAKPDGAGRFRGSPYLYNIRAVVADGTVPDGLVRSYADADLATVDVAHAAPGVTGREGIRQGGVEELLPSVLTEYYTPDQDWTSSFDQWSGTSKESAAYALPRRFAKGGHYTERWNAGVFGPALPQVGGLAAYRNDDQLVFDVPMFSDQGADHLGRSSFATAETTLFSQGRQFGAPMSQPGAGFFSVDAAPATYRLHTEVSRNPAIFPLSTRITADWTFSSGHLAARTDLPLLAVRFAPNLDEVNRAPAGQRFALPVTVQRNAVGLVQQQVTLIVEVSYDDGVSWQNAPLTPAGAGWTAALVHPAARGFVSLRATATDRSGNSVTETIVRGYELT